MQIFIIAALLIIILALITKQKKVTPKKDTSNESAPEEKLPVAGAYQKKLPRYRYHHKCVVLQEYAELL